MFNSYTRTANYVTRTISIPHRMHSTWEKINEFEQEYMGVGGGGDVPHRARQQKVAESTGSSMSGTRLVVSSSRNTWSRRRRWTGAMEEGLHLPRRQRLLVHVSGFIPSRCARRIGQHQFVAVFDIGAGKRVGLHAAGPYRRRGRSSVPRTRSGRSGLIRRRQRPAGAALW
jgi:hypothetical protein